MNYTVPEPRLKRSITLQFQGDWGAANLHRILGWLSQELVDRVGPFSRVGIWSGRGGLDSVQAVGRGLVDAVLAVPTAFVPMTIEGKTSIPLHPGAERYYRKAKVIP